MKMINSSEGFVLVVALIACIILSALAVLVITLSTGDLRTTVVILGGKKAMAAAESGYHNFAQSPVKYPNSFNPDSCTFAGNDYVTNCTNLTFNSWQDVDTANMPGAQYEITGVAKNISMPDITIVATETVWKMKRYTVQLGGRDRTYNSTMQVNVGVAYGPLPTGSGNLGGTGGGGYQ